MKVIGIGDNVCDKYIHLKTMYPGGQALNFAVYAGMLGAESSYLGAFGNDRVAEHVIKTLDEMGVEHARCRHYDGENGYARVTLENGDRVFLGSNKGGVLREHPLELDGEDLEYLKNFSHIHTSNNSYFDSQLPRLSALGLSVSYDFSGQWTDGERVKRVAPFISYGFLSLGSVSLEEAEKVCRNIYEKGCRKVIATRGSQGAVYYDGEEYFEQPPKLVKAVDTLGAGDSFAAAFLMSFVDSCEKAAEKMEKDRDYYRSQVRKALLEGADFASKICMVQGAFGHGTEIGAEE